jgi:dTDP-4-amino-4,6-dideoxygalactose transaminase
MNPTIAIMIEYENLAKLNVLFFEDFEQAFKTVMTKGWYILGEEVAHFENEWAIYCKTEYCVGVANGLDALVLSLRALELPTGSEVLGPSNTYIATILAVLQAGLVPILVEPSLEDYNLDPKLLGKALTEKTRAILVVHLYGRLAQMNA